MKDNLSKVYNIIDVVTSLLNSTFRTFPGGIEVKVLLNENGFKQIAIKNIHLITKKVDYSHIVKLTNSWATAQFIRTEEEQNG